MSSVNLMACLTTTVSAAVSIASIIAFTKADSTTEKAAGAAGAFLGLSAAVGSTTAWLRSDSNTSVSEYLSNSLHDSGIAMSGLITSTAGALAQAAIGGVKKAITDNVYDMFRTKPNNQAKV